MLMAERAGFLEAILAGPEDDAPRLVYADWLEEHGQPERAEFIRIECEQAVISPEPGSAPNRWDSPRFWELQDRLRKLYERHADDWFAPLFRAFRGEMDTHRGFPWHVALSARQFIDCGEAIFQAAPTIENVIIVRLGQNMPRLARCPALAHVRQLQFFETPFRAAQAEQLARSPHLGNLRELDIGFTDTGIGPRGARALANAASLRRLEHLDVHNHAIYDEGAAALLRSKNLATLTHLDLGHNGLTDETANVLAAVSHLGLVSLELMSNSLTSDGVAALAGAAHLGALEHLSLPDNRMGNAGATHLVTARFAGRLRKLHVADCGLDDQGTAVVFGGAWPNLTDLGVTSNVVGGRAASALVDNSSLARLSTLSVARCGIGRPVAAILGRASLPALRTLRAGYNPLGPEGVRPLLAGPLASVVRHLDFRGTALSDAGAEVVASSPVLSQVRWLELAENHISDRGAIALAESQYLDEVGALDLSRNAIGATGKDALTKRFGDRVRLG
jgi:uncharacterized protein (TIGR02996 family)